VAGLKIQRAKQKMQVEEWKYKKFKTLLLIRENSRSVV